MRNHLNQCCYCSTQDKGGNNVLVLHGNPRLCPHILSSAFGRSNLQSFTRQLNIYGIKKCTLAQVFKQVDVKQAI